MGLIEHVAKEEGLSVTVECFDLCEPLDEAWRGRFDAFVTDPMSNEACLGLFISRGRAMCKPDALGATAINAQAFPVLRKVLAEMGSRTGPALSVIMSTIRSSCGCIRTNPTG